MSDGRRGQGMGPLLIAVWMAVLAAPAIAPAAVIRLINNDTPNEGFNDPSPVAPVGGNSGTTLGAQRLIVFQRAVDIWATRVQSPVEIRVGATFDPLDCDESEVTLGEAGPTSVFRDFAGAPLPNTYYPSALADRLAGVDLDPNEDDIEAQFNSSFGTTCAFPETWYYGLDGAAGDNAVDLLTVTLHELGHGMGFLSLVDIDTGERMNDTDDVFSEFLVDDRTGKTFPQMTDAEREAAIVGAINPGVCSDTHQACTLDGDCNTGSCQRHTHLKWNGQQVVAASGTLTDGADALGRVEMYAAPQPVDGSSVSHWNDLLTPDELLEPAYTIPLHDIGLAGQALADIGWNLPGAPISCAGDCNDDGTVTIDELITGVGIALGNMPFSSCPAIDADGDGVIEVNELVGAVDHALNGCGPTATATPTFLSVPTPTPTPMLPSATPTPMLSSPTPILPSATPTDVGPTVTPAGSCPVNFDNSFAQNQGCLFIGTWNPSCGDAMLKVLFQGDGTHFLAAVGTDTPVGIAGNVTSATTAALTGWFTDFSKLSDFQALSGSATLSADGTGLMINHFDSPPFSINDCDFVDYEGSFNMAVSGQSAQQEVLRQLLPLVRHHMQPR